MPFPITRGLGSQGDGTGSGLLSIQGLGDPGAAIIGGTFALLVVEAFPEQLSVIFSVPVQAIGPAADPSQWVITCAGPEAIPVVTAVNVVGPKIFLTTTETSENILYTLHIPAFGVKDLSGNPFTGPFTYNYLSATGTDPILAMAGAPDGFHVRVIFNEPVRAVEALVAGNYTITGGAGLTVYDVVQETAQTYVLRTSLQVVGQSYTVTANNIRDLAGNLI